jgi:hypothetical protein
VINSSTSYQDLRASPKLYKESLEKGSATLNFLISLDITRKFANYETAGGPNKPVSVTLTFNCK